MSVAVYQRLRDEAKQRTSAFKGLTADQRRPLEEYLTSIAPLSKAKEKHWRDVYIMHLDWHGPNSGPAWLQAQREFDQRVADEHAQWVAKDADESAKRKAARAALVAEQKALIAEAIAKGVPVSDKVKRKKGCCALCHRPLTDPESIRLGIGPECRKAFI